MAQLMAELILFSWFHMAIHGSDKHEGDSFRKVEGFSRPVGEPLEEQPATAGKVGYLLVALLTENIVVPVTAKFRTG